jgi:hypothetical protein
MVLNIDNIQVGPVVLTYGKIVYVESRNVSN